MAVGQRSLLFAVPHRIGSLHQALAIFSKHGVNLARIESRPNASQLLQNHDQNISPRVFDSSRGKRVYDFNVEIEQSVDPAKVQAAINDLLEQRAVVNVTLLGGDQVPWFPRKIRDLDLFNQEIMEAGGDLEADHPGFADTDYRQRRGLIAQIARDYKHGEPIPRIDYTKAEVETWGLIYKRLTALYPKHACAQLNYVFPLLEENCGYSVNNIPQLDDVSNFLKDTTGWRVRPVAGLLSMRDFLNGLAFRVFHSTQYIRHHSKPLYTPEPDCVHELMGHVPLFADSDFADFSQEIGLASLGASDEDIQRLGTLYWFTVEFGVCKQNGERKAYGAGLLSSFGELEYSMTDKPQVRPFDPDVACETPYPITTFQPLYWITESFENMKDQMRNFANRMDRPFTVRYNPYTESVHVINNRRELVQMARTIRNSANLLQHALEKIEHLDRSSLIFEESNSSSKKQSGVKAE